MSKQRLFIRSTALSQGLDFLAQARSSTAKQTHVRVEQGSSRPQLSGLRRSVVLNCRLDTPVFWVLGNADCANMRLFTNS